MRILFVCMFVCPSVSLSLCPSVCQTRALRCDRIYDVIIALICLCYPMFLPRCMECKRGLAMRKLFVSLSVRLSVKRVHSDKTDKRAVQIFIPYEIAFSVVF